MKHFLKWSYVKIYVTLLICICSLLTRCDEPQNENENRIPVENNKKPDPCSSPVPSIYGHCLVKYPLNHSFLSESNIVLRWSAAMQSPLYEVWFGTNIDSLKSISKQISDTLLLPNLTKNRTYYWKFTGTDICGRIGISMLYRFTIVANINIPYVETMNVSGNQENPVALGGTVLYKGKMPVTERGIYFGNLPNCENTGSKLILGSDSGFFSCTLGSLNEDVIYYYRAFATNTFGTFFGKEFQFKTHAASEMDSITDIEGNRYGTARIGDQIWMLENLKTTKLNDGTLLSFVTNDSMWCGPISIKTKFTWFLNDSAYSDKYGTIYNGYVVTSNKICPEGWHVPSDDEWKTLELNLGMPKDIVSGIDMRGTDEGLKMKSIFGWNGNGNGFNTCRFNGLPGGYRHALGSFPGDGEIGQWWSSTKDQKYDYLWSRSLRFDKTGISRTNISMQFGCSIRCIKD